MSRKSQEAVRYSGDVPVKSDLDDATHLEKDLKHENGGVVLKSSLDDLGLLATAKKFWKVWRRRQRPWTAG